VSDTPRTDAIGTQASAVDAEKYREWQKGALGVRSDTPRTDANLFTAIIAGHPGDGEHSAVMACVARQLERELVRTQNLLSDIHDFLLPQEDADCVDGAFVPNQAMRFVQEIDAILPPEKTVSK
jgi:hypothetical protein